jgi:hypothetical protein
VPVPPDGVTTVTEVTLGATYSVVVPPYVVRTPETIGDGETGTVEVPPDGVMMVTEDGAGVEVEMRYEAGMEVTSYPDEVRTGAVLPGVSMVVVLPSGVVTVTLTGVGMWMVPVPPDGVLTGAEVSQVGRSMVAVPP